MRAILYMAVGALAFYLYTNPGEMDPVADKAKNLAKLKVYFLGAVDIQ